MDDVATVRRVALVRQLAVVLYRVGSLLLLLLLASWRARTLRTAAFLRCLVLLLLLWSSDSGEILRRISSCVIAVGTLDKGIVRRLLVRRWRRAV